MKIFITGIRGFLGSAMAEHFRARGHEVCGSARQASACVTALWIGEPFDPSVFQGRDVVIHAAHDFTPGARDVNIRGTRDWCEAASRSRQVFLSSYSARPDAASEYGATKHAIEKFFLDSGNAVVRPGLVIGNGGLFTRQRAALRKTPLVPLIGGGAQSVAIIGIGHFLDALSLVVEEDRRGAFNLFYAGQPSARDFVRGVKGGRARVLPIPFRVAIAAAYLVQTLRLPLPVNPGQVRALAADSTPAWRSDLNELLPGREKEFNLSHALRCV